jgi:phosphoribosylamine--glycine ligase
VPGKLKILLIGGGGREHALAWKMAASPLVGHVFCAPGNAGTAGEPGVSNVADLPADRGSPGWILTLARRLAADLTVIGPEDPLAAGVVDIFERAGLAVFGPTRAAARLEWSKAFAKDFMARQGIPTARFEVAETPAEAVAAVDRLGAPVVVKADGLAAGKGVTVAADRSEAVEAIHRIMEEAVFGEAGRRVVIEEGLQGPEVSVLALTDGEHVLPFSPAQDHKRLLDGDKGPNTGGMGAYCPAGLLGPEGERVVLETILKPTVKGMAAEGARLRGVLFAGLMLTSSGPKVLEFNCRFGDPETQVILPLLESDLVELMLRTVDPGRGRLKNLPSAGAGLAGSWLRVGGGAAACVVVASGGYPGGYESGKPIHGLDAIALWGGIKVFHAGTKLGGAGGRELVSAGGRVLNIAATAGDPELAVAKVYRALALIGFEGAHYRTDIAAAADTSPLKASADT